jgi:hypothetical protein
VRSSLPFSPPTALAGVRTMETVERMATTERGLKATNAGFALREQLDENISTTFGKGAALDASFDVSVVEQLRAALSRDGVRARVMDIFKEFDDDGAWRLLSLFSDHARRSTFRFDSPAKKQGLARMPAPNLSPAPIGSPTTSQDPAW